MCLRLIMPYIYVCTYVETFIINHVSEKKTIMCLIYKYEYLKNSNKKVYTYYVYKLLILIYSNVFYCLLSLECKTGHFYLSSIILYKVECLFVRYPNLQLSI